MPESPGTYPDQPQWRTKYHRLIWGRSADGEAVQTWVDVYAVLDAFKQDGNGVLRQCEPGDNGVLRQCEPGDIRALAFVAPGTRRESVYGGSRRHDSRHPGLRAPLP